jgi:phage-related minor tail protein
MKDLVVVENLDLVPFFTKGDQVDSILKRLTEEADSYVAGDLSVKKNRDAVKAMVTKFTKSKTYLESKGKELAAEYKAIPKAIDANRKRVKDTITELQEVVRKPLTDWENEQKAIADKLAAEEAATLLSKQKEADHELALLLDDKFNQEAKAEADRLEQERIAYEAELKAKAAEEATRLAEQQAQAEKQRIEDKKEEALRNEQRAILEKEQAIQREKQQAEQAKIDAENAEKRRIADIEAAKQAQIAQQKAEQERLKAEQKARDEDKEHRKNINNEASKALQTFAGITEDQAKAVIIALVKGQIPNANLTY